MFNKAFLSACIALAVSFCLPLFPAHAQRNASPAIKDEGSFFSLGPSKPAVSGNSSRLMTGREAALPPQGMVQGTPLPAKPAAKAAPTPSGAEKAPAQKVEDAIPAIPSSAGENSLPWHETSSPTPTAKIRATPTEKEQPVATSASLSASADADDDPCKSNYDLLRKELKRIIREQALDKSRVTGYVVDCDCPIVAFDQNSEISFSPGSAAKMITTAAALDILGSDYTYKTTVGFSGTIANNVVRGNLVVRGVGDPTIGSQFGDNGRDPAEVFRKWARKMKEAKIDTISGGIVGDDRFFDDQRELKTWPLQDRGEWYVAQVSALTFNDNCLNLLFRKGRRIGKSVDAEVVPGTEYVRFHNAVVMGGKGEIPEVLMRREENSNLLNATGRAPYRSPYASRASVENPSLYFATVLEETLRHEGVHVAGGAIDARSIKDKRELGGDISPLVVEVSPPLSEIVRITNQYGQNVYADSLLKTLGKVSEGEGSFAAGNAAVRKFLERKQLDDPETVLVDGSGLSFSDSITPRLLGQFLAAMAKDTNAETFMESLGRPGRFGLMEHRFGALRKTNADAAERIRAISGLVDSNYTLAGYATTDGGAHLAFVFVINDPRVDRLRAYDLLDNLGTAVATSAISVAE